MYNVEHNRTTTHTTFKPDKLCEISGSQGGEYEHYCLLGCFAL
jgi:hypothetical protein